MICPKCECGFNAHFVNCPDWKQWVLERRAKRNEKLIGLSLSFCVADLIKGHVSISDVAFIYSGTKARDGEDWESIISIYRKAYWTDDPDEGERLTHYFIDNGLIIQPRLEGKVLFKGRLNWLGQSEFNAYCKENLSGSN